MLDSTGSQGSGESGGESSGARPDPGEQVSEGVAARRRLWFRYERRDV